MAGMIGNFLKGISRDEVPAAVSLILGRPTSKPLDLSGAAVLQVVNELIKMDERDYQKSFAEALDFGEAVKIVFEKGRLTQPEGMLTIKGVSHAFEEISEMKEPGSRKKKREMRHGVDEGMVLEALSHTLDIDIRLLRRAHMLTGDTGEVAKISISEGAEGLKKLRVNLFMPVKPMLAQMAYDTEEVFHTMEAPFALEYKLDGARIQIHKKGKDCRLFTRNLDDITESLPDMVDEIVRNTGIREAIFYSEVIAVDREGSPFPFQVLMQRLGRVRDREAAQGHILYEQNNRHPAFIMSKPA